MITVSLSLLFLPTEHEVKLICNLLMVCFIYCRHKKTLAISYGLYMSVFVKDKLYMLYFEKKLVRKSAGNL